MESEAAILHFWAPVLVVLPSYIPEAWHNRIRIEIDERGVHYLWTGWSNGEGHGKVRVKGKAVYVHREVIRLKTGVPVPKNKVVDHLCRHRPCMNFDCLEPVTVAVNTYRGDGAYYQYKKAQEEDPYDPPF